MESCVCSLASGHNFLDGTMAYSTLVYIHYSYSTLVYIITHLVKWVRGEFTAVRTAETVLSICHSPNYRKTVFLFQLLRENRRNIYSPSLILSTRALQYTSIIKLSAGKCLGEHWLNFSLETF